jgi:hypothetical protein
VQTSAAHARRYEGVAALGVEDSGAVGSHVSRAAISDGLDSRNTQVMLSYSGKSNTLQTHFFQVLEHVLQQLGALTDMMCLVQQRMQVSPSIELHFGPY